MYLPFRLCHATTYSRGVFVLFSYGTVHETGQSMKRKLHLESRIIDRLSRHDNQVSYFNQWILGHLKWVHLTDCVRGQLFYFFLGQPM
jgi:hypothetical protein